MNNQNLTIVAGILTANVIAIHRENRKLRKQVRTLLKVVKGHNEIIYQQAVDQIFVNIANHYDD